MNLSHLTKYERKTLYSEKYKHLLDAIKNGPLMICDNKNGNAIIIDDPIELRFTVNGKVKSFNLDVMGLLSALKNSLKSAGKYKYELYGNPDENTFDKVNID